MNKREMREAVRARFPGQAERTRESECLCRLILESPVFEEAGTIAGYVPMNREADVLPVLLEAWKKNKTVLLPRVEGKGRMTLRRVRKLSDMSPGAYGIPEPKEDAPLEDPLSADLLLIPLEAIDWEGFRLGKGGGYYDRLLPLTRGLTLGCAMAHQQVERVPREEWDQPLNACAFADGLIFFK